MYHRLRFCFLTWLLILAGCQSEGSTESHQARQQVARATEVVSPSEVLALENRAVGLMGQFKYDAAAKLYERLAAMKARSQESQIDLAIALLNRRGDGDLTRCEELLEEAISAGPENLRALYCRALLHFNSGQTDKALQLFQQTAHGDPGDSYARYYVGQCLLSQQEYADAFATFRTALEIDPYLRSAYYGAFQAAQRLGKQDEARQYLASFQKLGNNPRSRLAELKYTRMGLKAEVAVGRGKSVSMAVAPDGPLFSELIPLTIVDDSEHHWTTADEQSRAPNITVADVDGDGRSDLFIGGAFDPSTGSRFNAVLYQRDGHFELDAENPLATVPGVTAALWGDYDDDGQLDVYLCCAGHNQLWRQAEAGQWVDMTSETGTAGRNVNTVDGACYDADHDGDLDFLVLDRDGGCQLFSNNRDGTFRDIAEQLGIDNTVSSGRRVLIVDLDSDDDADIILFSDERPQQVLLNDRLWEYRQASEFAELCATKVSAAVAADANVDGQVELYTIGPTELLRWEPGKTGKWRSSHLYTISQSPSASSAALALYDCDGDTQLEILLRDGSHLRVLELDGTERAALHAESIVGPFAVLVRDDGPEVVGFLSGTGPQLWKSGPGRFPFALVQLSGRTDKGAEMRSNGSGIGAGGAARIGDQWATLPGFRTESGPGQSLQPYPIGLGGAKKIDFLRLVWPDGVSQSELDLQAGRHHAIAETQRQAGSCPLLFVWNGKEFSFVADLLGAGGIGFNLGRGEYYDPRPQENLLLPQESLQPKDGRLVLKLGEPMEEICYFDAVRLVAYDLPPGWQMTLDERFGAAEPMPTGQPLFFRHEQVASRATNDRGADVTSAVCEVDRKAAPLVRGERLFVGMAKPHSVTLFFEQPLDELVAPVLMIDGWVEYAYSQTAFAAWQAGREYLEPTLEARGADGQWYTIAERFGYMAGTPRRATLPLDPTQLPQGARQLRVSSNLEIYWDRFAVVDIEPCPQAERREIRLLTALIDDVGFSARTLLPQRYPTYNYDQRPPLGDTRHPAGFYTAMGDALELVEQTDDAVAIIGPGEEMHLEFDVLRHDPPAGWTRRYIVEADGWCKDADLFTKAAGTVEPLPTRGIPLTVEQNAMRESLHRKYNTRFKSSW